MDLTNNIDLLDDEEEEKPLIAAQPTKPAVPPSLSHVFNNRDDLETAVDSFVPKSLYNDARDRASKADELLSSNKKQMSPLMDEMSKFRDELDNVSNDVPMEGRMPFWEGQKIEDPDMFIDEIDNQFNSYNENKDEAAFLGFGESDDAERAKRGLPLKGKWDGIIAKYRSAATDRDEIQKYANEAYSVRDEFTKRYLSMGDPQRRALQDIWEAQNGDADETTRGKARSRMTAETGYDPYLIGGATDMMGHAARTARARKAIHQESNYQAELKREYDEQRLLEKQGIRFTKNGYFAGFPLNVSKKEAEILANHKADPQGAMAKFGEGEVDKARFSEVFNASMLDFRSARHQLMIANASKDPKKIEEAEAGFALYKRVMREALVKGNDMEMLGDLVGRMQSKEEMGLSMGLMKEIADEKRDAGEDRWSNSIKSGLAGTWNSLNVIQHAVGLQSDEEHIKKQAEFAAQSKMRPTSLSFDDVDGAGSAFDLASEFIGTMGAQYGSAAPVGIVAGAAAQVGGSFAENTLEKLKKSKGLNRFKYLRGLLHLTDAVASTKWGKKVLGGAWKSRSAIAGGFATGATVEYGGSYLEAIQNVKTDADPEGIDALNQEAHIRLLNDPKALAQVRRAALKRTAAIATVEAFTMFAGGLATKTMQRMGATGVVVPALARGVVDFGTGAAGEVAGMKMMHSEMGMSTPFVTFGKNKEGKYEVGGYVGENMEDIIMEGIAGPMMDAGQSALQKTVDTSVEFTQKAHHEWSEATKKDLADKNFNSQVESITDEALEAEKGTASSYRGDAKVIGEETQTEHGTSGIVDLGNGKQHEFHTAKDNESLQQLFVDRFGEGAMNEKQTTFLGKFFEAMEQEGGSDWRDMKIVFASEMAEGVEGSPMSFNQSNNVLTVNTSGDAGLSNYGEINHETNNTSVTTGKRLNETRSLVANIVHEVGHFSERFMTGEGKVKRLFESIDGNVKDKEGKKQGMFLAHLEYNIDARSEAEQSTEAWKKARDEFYARYEADDGFANRTKSEWWAFQYSRVARDQIQGMDKGVLGMIKKFYQKLRPAFKDMIGDKNLSNAEVDKEIASMFGFEGKTDGATINNSPTSEVADGAQLARDSADMARPVVEPVEETDNETSSKEPDAFEKDQDLPLPEVKPAKPKVSKKKKTQKAATPESQTTAVPSTSTPSADDKSSRGDSDVLTVRAKKKTAGSLKRVISSKNSTQAEKDAALNEIKDRVKKNPKSSAKLILDSLEKQKVRKEVSESKKAKTAAEKNYAVQASKNPEKILGKNIKGNSLDKNPYFNVNKEGTIIGIQNPETSEWSGIKPLSSRGRKKKSGEKVNIVKAIEKMPVIKTKPLSPEKLKMQEQFASKAFKDSEQYLNKPAVSWLKNNKNFKVNGKGTLVGIRNPTTGKWKGESNNFVDETFNLNSRVTTTPKPTGQTELELGARPALRAGFKNTDSEAYRQIEKEKTPNFKKYFKGSKAVSKNGEPKVFFHGTVGTFTAFQAMEASQTGRKAIYLSPDPMTASTYGRAKRDRLRKEKGLTNKEARENPSLLPKGRMIPAYVSLKNPLNLDPLMRAAKRKGVEGYMERKAFALSHLKPEHDGFTFSGDVFNGAEIAVFNSEQLKDVRNDGNFATANPNILGARKGSNNQLNYISNEALQRQIASGRVYAQEVRGNAFRADSATQGEAFHAGISRTYKDHPVGKAVEVKDLDFYKDPKNGIFMSGDGSAGVAITDYADLVSVFKHPTSTAKPKEILAEASQYAKTLDAYDVGGFLPNLYSEFGFKPVARVKFNKEYAPDGWPYDLLGEPDIVLMVKDPEASFAPIAMETKGFAKVRDSVPYMEADTAWDYAGEIGQQAQSLELGARKGEPEHGLLGNVENGEILYNKSGDLGMMNHDPRGIMSSKGNPWRYRESSGAVYFWEGKPTEMDKDAVTSLLESKGYDAKNLKFKQLNANAPSFTKDYEDAHAFPLMVSPKKKFSDEFGARKGAKLKLTGEIISPKGKVSGSYKKAKFTGKNVTHGWFFPDGSFVNVFDTYHIHALNDIVQKNPDSDVSKKVIEGKMKSSMAMDYGMPPMKQLIRQLKGNLSMEDGFRAGLVRVRVEKDSFGKNIFLEGNGKNPPNDVATLAAELAAIDGEYNLWWENADNSTFGPTLLYPTYEGQFGMELGARPTNLHQTTYLTDLDKTLDALQDRGVKDKNDVLRSAAPIEASPFEGGRVRSIAIKLNKLFSASQRIPFSDKATKKQISKAGNRVLDVLNRAIYEFPNFASWYQSRINMAVKIFTELDPDLTKPENKSALMITLAITSNGADVKSQTFDGWDIYKGFKKNGKLGDGKSKSARGEAIVKSLKLADELAQKLGGFDKLGVFLSRKDKKSELVKELIALGYTKTRADKLTNGESVSEVIPFSLVFGPKLGSFFNNLNGDFDTTTMDRWFMRTLGRAMGQQVKKADRDAKTKKYPKGKRQALLDIVQKAREDPTAIKILETAGVRQNLKDPAKLSALIAKHFIDADNRKNLSEVGNNLRKTANAFHKIADGYTLIEAPEGGAHRSWTRKVMADALEKFNEGRNKKLVPAEAQALLWYYEKLVHEGYGSRQKDANPDYASSANELFKAQRGVASGNFESGSGIKPRRGGRRSATFGGNDSRAPVNGIELDPSLDPTGFNNRIFGDELGARQGQTPVIANAKANAQQVASASQKAFLNQSLSFVERLKQVAEIATDPIRLKLQDKMLPVRRLIEVLEEATGSTFDDKLQTYVQHENYHGKTGAELTNQSEDHERPIAQSIAENKVDVEVLDDYLHLRHAQERNAVNREQSKVVTVSYRKNGRLVQKQFRSYGAEKKAKDFSTGFKVSWVNTFADGTVETKTKEFQDQSKAEAFAKKKIKRTQKPNWPRQGNIKLKKGRLQGRTISTKSDVEAGSGYSDDASRHALALNERAIYAMHVAGKLTEPQRDRIVRMIKTIKQNPAGVAAYEHTSRLVDKMNRLSLERQYKSGLIGKKDFDRIRKAYKHFIPLRGWEEVSSYYDHSNVDVKTQLNQTVLPISRGMNTLKHKFRSSGGLVKDSMVSNHLAYAFALSRQGIVESQKNEVMRSFFDLVASAHKDPALKGISKNLFSYTKGVMVTTIDKYGKPRKQLDPRWKDDPNIVGMKINGVTVALRLDGDRLDGTSSVARALKNLGAEKSGVLVNTVKVVTRTMAALRTTLSPAFTPVNFVRDWGMGLYSIKGLDSDFKDQVARGEITEQKVEQIKTRALKNMYNPKTLRSAFQGALLQTTGGRGMLVSQGVEKLKGSKFQHSAEVQKWADIFQDFSDNGGRINFFGFDSVQQLAKKFGGSVREFDPNDPQRMKTFLKGAYEFMDKTSGAVENLVRVTAYDAFVKEGISKQKAANLALNLTTNFTRKGEWTTALNGMYLFFNAGVQGSAKVLSTAYKSPKARKFLGGAVLLGFMNSFINRLMSDEDDELEMSAWDRVSPYSKTHNLHFFLPSFGEKHAKIPTPYGINVFTSAGTLLESTIFGNMKLGDAALTWGATALESFSPIGGSSMAAALTPTALQPIMDLSLNQDFKGAPVYKEDKFNNGTPDSALHWSSTTEMSKSIAQGLNRFTGGDLQRSGAIDISPDTIDYMANYIFGGLGSFIGRSGDLASKATQSDEASPTLNDIPILRRFVGDKTVYYDTERFYNLVNHTGVSKERIEHYRKNGTPEEAQAVIQYEAPRMKLNSVYKKTVQKQLATLRRQIEAVENHKILSGQQKVTQIEILKRKRTRLMNKFIKTAERMGIDDY